MKRIFKLIVVVILLITIGSYFIPAKKKDFFTLYKKNDSHSNLLKEFQSRKTKSLLVDNIKWQYYVGGKGKKTVLLLHGMGGSYDLWWQQIVALEQKYRVISYTLPEEVNSLETAKNGILKILDKEKIDKFYGVGTSMGGYILQYLVQKIPNRIEKVVFGNTFPVNDLIVSKNRKKSKIVKLLPEILIAKLANKQLKNKLIPAGKNSKLLAAFLPSLPFSKKQFINRYSVVIDPFSIKNNYQINRISKLIIQSDNDPLVEKELRDDLIRVYPKAKVFTFHNEGHFPYINASEKYNKVILDFFNEKNPYVEIEKTISNYFKVRKNANIDLLKQAFSRDAMLFTVKDSLKLNISIAAYFKKVLADEKKEVKTTIFQGSVVNSIANFQTVFKYPNVTYHDYLSLMKINDDWKITSKTFTKEQK